MYSTHTLCIFHKVESPRNRVQGKKTRKEKKIVFTEVFPALFILFALDLLNKINNDFVLLS